MTYRGEPVAEIRPLEKRAQSLEERTRELERRGVLWPAKGPRKPFKIGDPVPGALERFLAERGRSWES